MKHRHLNTTDWTLAAIDSAIEFGDLSDWRELFERARHDRSLAQRVLAVAEAHRVEGASDLARSLALRLWPDLASGGRSAA